ncbi:precorrin-6y C5,15-methyltransferase (decarboxylating) subunit CbiE [Camelimonas abortus]|uniref:Precorrin-6y C5,15-methyltransferase (Decarboxylating) subunit CbiE n=1 Tax=Camelimonas abortus TaxID=1017184 RepID=A0ABV7LIE6_9HYPH
MRPSNDEPLAIASATAWSPVASTTHVGPWLSVVGIGEDGLDGLSPAAARAVSSAAVVYGGSRHLALAAALITGEAIVWASPFSDSLEQLLALRGQAVCVLASGDPMHFGVGATLARRLPPAEMQVYAQPSAFTLAAAHLGWPLQDVTLISLHGRDETALLDALAPRARVIALTSDGEAPVRLTRMLTDAGWGQSEVHVLEAMGGPQQRHTASTARDLPSTMFNQLNVMAFELQPDADILPPGPAFGLPDDAFAHDGQITKQSIRSITMTALSPRSGDLLWDLGAGSGSVSIEWLRLSPCLRAIAVEASAERVARIRQNARRLCAARLVVYEGRSRDVTPQLAPPDAVFIGGGADSALIESAMAALKPGGRLVINAVTLETQALVTDMLLRHGGAATQISIAHAAPVGSLHGWRSAMPVIQWRWLKATTGAEAAS